jgi:hypothetical protein
LSSCGFPSEFDFGEDSFLVTSSFELFGWGEFYERFAV